MKFKTLSNFNLKNKRVLLRLDLNTEIIKGKAQLSERMKAHLETLKELKKNGAKTVILAHQARPGESDFISLKQHSKLIGVKFVPDILGKKAIKAIIQLNPGEVLLLENIRSLKEEFAHPENNDLINILVPLFDLYINDAFSVSHREQISITGFPKYLPSGIGRVMEKEINSLEKINLEDCLFILGGTKPKENIPILAKHENILTTGVFGQLCTIAKGKNLGAQNKFLKKKIKEFVPILKPLVSKAITPLDFALKVNGKRKELSLEEFPSNYEIFDIGKKTQELYIEKIKNAKSIFMKGVAGYCEEKQFCEGTKVILQAIADSKAFSLVGGGHTTQAIEKLKINKNNFGYISLSGGALDEYVSGKKLPGLEVLKK